MQLKSITTIIVLLLVVASLLVAGCTTSTTNQTPSTTSSTDDAFLEKYLEAFKNLEYADKNYSIKAWNLTWINNTSAHLEVTGLKKSTNITTNLVETYTVFPTSQDATSFVDAMNKTAYSNSTTQYREMEHAVTYQNVTGHAPQIFKQYDWYEGSGLYWSEYRYHVIYQIDNVVVVSTVKELSTS